VERKKAIGYSYTNAYWALHEDGCGVEVQLLAFLIPELELHSSYFTCW
jgi:hypothetical protein